MSFEKSQAEISASDDDSNPDFVRALARGLAVIESFDGVQGSASLSEIAARAKLSRGTVRRALITLQSLGYLAEEAGRFSLLPRALRLGYSYLSSQPLWTLPAPTLKKSMPRLAKHRLWRCWTTA